MWLYDKIPEDKKEYWKMHKEYKKLLKKKTNIKEAFSVHEKKDEIYSILDEMERNMIMPEGWAEKQKEEFEKELNSPYDFTTKAGNLKKKIVKKVKKKFKKK